MRLATVLLALTLVINSSTVVWAAPPSRPCALTPTQFDALRQMETQPEHDAILDVHATYKSERERSLDFTTASDDFWTIVYQAGFPGALAAVLICAAPL